MIPPRLQQFLIRAIWPLACLVVAGPTLVTMWFGRLDHEALLCIDGRIASSIAAHFTSAPSALSAGSDRAQLIVRLLFWMRSSAMLVYIVLAMLHHSAWARRGQRRRHVLYFLQLCIAMGNDNGLIYALAAQIGWLPRWRDVAAWLVPAIVLHGLMKLLLIALPQTSNDNHFMYAALVVGFGALLQTLIASTVHLGLRERSGRLALAAAHAELLATQALLDEAVRASERLRIARDLHDVAGHHLTALKLHLDLATRQAGGQAPAALATASELAASLLAEVRVLVSTEREARHIDLSHALAALCAGVPSLQITLDIDARLAIDSAAAAHTVFCAVQEAISNVLRHARATRMTITLRRSDAGDITIDMHDNGRGSSGPEGNGLRGMRERLALAGGQLVAANASHGGFSLHLRLPANGVAA